MESDRKLGALRSSEVPMVEPEAIRQMRELRRRGVGIRRIARQLGMGRNTVRRYLRGGEAAEHQVRPKGRCLDEEQRAEAVRLLTGPAEGNAVLAARLLAERGAQASVRTVQRAVAGHRQEVRAAEVATVRYETPPGQQMQIDFGERLVRIAGAAIKVYLFVAVLSYSRRLFVRASLSQRQDEWREGLVGAFRCFGGLPDSILIDNAGALVVGRDAVTQTATLHPTFAAWCRDWDVKVRVCRPYRARTKGKTESGIKYVKRNAVAGLEFVSFAAFEAHLAAWMVLADGRVHGTTHEVPRERFERDERQHLRPLPSTSLLVRERRLERRVATDCFVDVDTVRYSVPHRLVRKRVEVLVGDEDVRIFLGSDEVARHRRVREPHRRVVDAAHFDGLLRRHSPSTGEQEAAATAAASAAGGRSLAEYASVIEGGVQ